MNNKSLSNIHDWKERRLGGEKKEATRCYKSIALQDVTKKSNQSLQYSNDNIQKKIHNYLTLQRRSIIQKMI